MRLRTLLRSSSAVVMLPLLLAYVYLLLGEALTAFITPGYGPSAIGNATFALPAAAAACAAGGAWESARVRRGRVLDQAPARSALAIVLPLLVPVRVMGLLGMGLALVLTSNAAGALPALSHTGMLLAYGLLLAAFTLAGHLLGRVLPGIAAAPVALVAGFCLTAFPGSFDTAWLRHLVAGGYDSCCSAGMVIDPKAVWAPLILAAGVCAAALVCIQQAGKRARRLAIAGATAIATTALAVWTATGMSYDPIVARDRGDVVCDTGGRPKICVWPETPNRQEISRLTRGYVARLEQAGLEVPATLTAVPLPGEAPFGVKGTLHSQDIPAHLANILLPRLPDCARTSGKYPAFPARGPLSAWLTAIATGAAPQPAPGRFSPDDAALAQKVLQQPRETQRAWYDTNRQALTGCDALPRLELPGAAR